MNYSKQTASSLQKDVSQVKPQLLLQCHKVNCIEDELKYLARRKITLHN